MHSDREHRAALTIATGYIVVFKKTASKEEVQKWKDEIVKDSEYLTRRIRSKQAHRTSAMVIDGQVTHEYGTVLNGFAAKIAPQTFQLLTQSATDDGPIAYIGLCTSLTCGLGCHTDSSLQNPMACSPPNRKAALLTSHIERALCKVMFIVKCT
jgi:hypothetical protein